MKKSAVAAAVVVVIGGAWLGATAYTGHRIAGAYEARLAKLEKQFPFLRVVDRQTDRRLLSSTYSGKVQVGCVPDAAAGDKGGKPLVIGFRDQVRHGPLPGFQGFGAAVIDSQITLPEDAPEALRKYVAGMAPEDIRTTVGYGGDYKTALRLPAGEVAFPAGQLSWPEVRATGSGKLDGSASSFDGHVPEIAFRGTDRPDARAVNFKLVNLRFQGANQGAGSVWLRPGTSSMEVERIELLGDADGKAISAQIGRIRYLTELGADKDLLNVKATIAADATLQFGADAKPIQLDNIEFQESIKRLHGPTLQKVLDASMADLSTCGAAGARGERPRPDGQRHRSARRPAAPVAAKAGAARGCEVARCVDRTFRHARRRRVRCRAARGAGQRDAGPRRRPGLRGARRRSCDRQAAHGARRHPRQRQALGRTLIPCTCCPNSTSGGASRC
ncbi:MAG: DUF945 family protein [Variovorax sp.]|nr:MAG: DUF945 family protein [Variovorax sp.]